MITPSQRQILEAVLEALPEKINLSFNKYHHQTQVDGYNKALEDVRAIINEFLAQETKKHPGGRPVIKDEFTDLNVSRQRKSQLRKKKLGLCISCNKPLVTKNFCRYHQDNHNAYQYKSKELV